VHKPHLLRSCKQTCTLLAIAAALVAQQPQSALKHHYDEAYRLQSEGKIPAADAEHAEFLSLALHQLANGHANAGDYAQAAPLYDEALALDLDDLALRKDYAEAAKDAQDIQKAQALLEHAFTAKSATFPPSVQAEAHRVLGDVQLTQSLNDAALANYKAAYSLDPGYESLYALAAATLTIQGDESAAPLFTQLIAHHGDTAATHMAIARAYGQAAMPARAEAEYRKALAKDPSTPGAHFGIGASLMNATSPNPAKAQAEFHKELALHSNDAMSWFELGRIAAGKEESAKEAETDLKRAAELSPRNPDIWIELGKLYIEQQNPQAAEPAFRQAIAVTIDPARNRYAIERAHFHLGKILFAAGKKDEAEKELAISEEMLDRRRKQEEDGLHGRQMVNTTLRKTHEATPAEAQQLNEFERNLAPLLAGSYNNLGVHAAMASNFKTAEADFAEAAKWQPALHGVDSNWGRAAYEAHDYQQAVAPLERSIEEHPEDIELRSMLTECKQRAVDRTN